MVARKNETPQPEPPTTLDTIVQMSGEALMNVISKGPDGVVNPDTLEEFAEQLRGLAKSASKLARSLRDLQSLSSK